MMRMSKLQEHVLTWTFLAMAEGWILYAGWGVRLKHLRNCIFIGDWPLSGSERASFSRSLKRLEQRGFIVRANDITGKAQTTVIRLTRLGLETAEALARQYVEGGADRPLSERFKAALMADVEVNVRGNP